MQTLALYADEWGDACQCLISHQSMEQLDLVEKKLPAYSDGCTLIFIRLADQDERPEVLDGELDEVSCEYLTL